MSNDKTRKTNKTGKISREQDGVALKTRFKVRAEGYEKRKFKSYFDDRGTLTIRVGFNLIKHGAREKIQSLGLNYDSVCAGKVALTDHQVDVLLDADVVYAIGAAHNIISNFTILPANKQLVVVDMIFTLGDVGFCLFIKTIAAIEKRDFETAADEMVDSDWYYQLGQRARDDVALMRAREV